MDPLKLIALDSQDLDVVAAHVQDAVVKVEDMRFDPKTRQFALVINRFAWEEAAGTSQKSYQRRRSALHFDRVLKARSKSFSPTDGGKVLALLTVQFFPDGEDGSPGGEIELIFADDMSVSLAVECIEAQLADLGPAWETHRRPKHPERD